MISFFIIRRALANDIVVCSMMKIFGNNNDIRIKIYWIRIDWSEKFCKVTFGLDRYQNFSILSSVLSNVNVALNEGSFRKFYKC